jgi:Phosphoenolpyruvate phosphomutase
MTQREKAELLAQLQQTGSSLLLPNAWDAASARLFEEAGFLAIGTTSGGIAYALGYLDGEQMAREAMLQAVARRLGLPGLPGSRMRLVALRGSRVLAIHGLGGTESRLWCGSDCDVEVGHGPGDRQAVCGAG